MYYTMHVAGLERRLPICPVSDSLSIGAFVIFGDAELTVSAARDLLRLAPEHDYILTAEAKGIPLAHEMARQNHEETYFVARKAPKLYMPDALCVTVQSITTAREQKLYLDRADAERMRGKRILIVDDVISTGESLRAVEQLVAAGSFFVYNMKYEPVILCLLYCFISSKVGDIMLRGFKEAIKFEVVTDRPEALEEAILQSMGHGVTEIRAVGGYTHEKKTMLICVINKHQIVQFQRLLKQYPGSFAYLSSVKETVGNFRNIH